MKNVEHAEWITITALGGIALVLALAVLFTALARRLRQPAVIGEIMAGICLGPSLLGLFPGDLPARLFPGEVRSHLELVAQIGLLLFMFILGWDFDYAELRGDRRTLGTVWFGAWLFPMALGVLLAWLLYFHSDIAGGREGPGFGVFALFLGTALAIAAFPVLGRIITERGLQHTRTGALALALAALDDILAWSLLAVVVAWAQASGIGSFLGTMGWGAVYVAVMLVVVRPVLERLARFARHGAPYAAMIVAAGALGSAHVTGKLGLHVILGAFLFGLIMPRHTEPAVLRTAAREPLERISRLLLPLLFVVTGLSLDLTALSATGAAYALLVVVVACAGKFGGVLLSARMTGMGWHQATTLGVLMNTRGLTQLVILNAGLGLGLLSSELFTVMVVMALCTTVMTAPLLSLLLRRGAPAEAGGPAGAEETGLVAAGDGHADAVPAAPRA
ncbi:cation/H(+) antiporter [Streptomyces armeniacus]|uniref:Cation/H(+) antiporter n=1 Tax=Streptomyces armeniacus TaxID=83291 RepID=A0A345XRP3_9ACTN|nr:cation:proton antiporter [Streptomyces armeniacus]AWS21274.1 membrane antiporter [Streptomyces armeniacus]AXK34309.1 cation/H(+) antiporter [Streptomyces armeniacus]AZY92001.1 membrane antiporter [Streptomyces armeniacus]